MVKKIEGTLQDWDALQLKLADVMSRIFQARSEVVNAQTLPAAARHQPHLDALYREEDEVRKQIAGLSRHLHIELKNRKE